MKIRPLGAELFHADRRIRMTTLTVAFRNFVNAPKNYPHLTNTSLRVLRSVVNLTVRSAG